MVTPELIAYIKGQLSLGQSKENIKNILLANNWSESDAQEALRVAAGVAQDSFSAVIPSEDVKPSPTVISPETIQITTQEPLSPAVEPKASSPVFPMESPVQQVPPFSQEGGAPLQTISVSGATSVTAAKVQEPEYITLSQTQKPSPSKVTTQPVASAVASSSPAKPLFESSNDFLKIGIGLVIGIVIGIAGSFGWGSIRKLLLKSPIPINEPSVLVSPSSEVSATPPAPDLDFISYTNSKHGFSIDYPKGWYMNESGFMGAIVMFSETEQDGASVNIVAGTTTKTATIDALVEAGIKAIENTFPDYVVKSNDVTTVGLKPARLVEGTFSLGGVLVGNMRLYVLSGEGKYVVATATLADESWDTYKPLFLSIFGTMKIL